MNWEGNTVFDRMYRYDSIGWMNIILFIKIDSHCYLFSQNKKWNTYMYIIQYKWLNDSSIDWYKIFICEWGTQNKQKNFSFLEIKNKPEQMYLFQSNIFISVKLYQKRGCNCIKSGIIVFYSLQCLSNITSKFSTSTNDWVMPKNTKNLENLT